MLSDDFFSAYQVKLEREDVWLCLLNPACGMLWRNPAWRQVCALPPVSPWVEAVLSFPLSDERPMNDAISRVLKSDLLVLSVKVHVLRLPGEAERVPFTISFGKLRHSYDGHVALVLMHLLRL